MSSVKYPNITVKLSGEDGNAFAILARVGKALRANKLGGEVWEEFYMEATDGDYDHLLQTVMKYVNVE